MRETDADLVPANTGIETTSPTRPIEYYVSCLLPKMRGNKRRIWILDVSLFEYFIELTKLPLIRFVVLCGSFPFAFVFWLGLFAIVLFAHFPIEYAPRFFR